MSIDHRAEAEEHLKVAAREFLTPEGDPTHALAAAQVHATLAAGQVAAADVAAYRLTITTMRFALIRHIAEGRALSETDEAYQHACGLATHLDAVGLNVDDAVDAYIQDHLGMEPRDMDLCPTERHAKWVADCASMPMPWDTDGLPS